MKRGLSIWLGAVALGWWPVVMDAEETPVLVVTPVVAKAGIDFDKGRQWWSL